MGNHGLLSTVGCIGSFESFLNSAIDKTVVVYSMPAHKDLHKNYLYATPDRCTGATAMSHAESNLEVALQQAARLLVDAKYVTALTGVNLP